MLVPYYIVINYDRKEFELLVRTYNEKKLLYKNEERKKLIIEYNNRLQKINIMPISNGETIKIEFENEIIVFATNNNFEDTSIYPLAVTSKMSIKANKKITLKTIKFLKNIELSLELQITIVQYDLVR